MRRRLSLVREVLAPLTNDDLAAVAGAAPDATGGCPQSFRVRECPTALTCDTSCRIETR